VELKITRERGCAALGQSRSDTRKRHKGNDKTFNRKDRKGRKDPRRKPFRKIARRATRDWTAEGGCPYAEPKLPAIRSFAHAQSLQGRLSLREEKRFARDDRSGLVILLSRCARLGGAETRP
jgi:hypothetical protein